MDGLLIADKPQGLTSFDVVRRIRGTVRRVTGTRKPKVGHTGTLDPFATGVLPICVGQATKLARFLIEGDKVYSATLKLGETTDTDDTDGEVIATGDWRGLDEAAVRDLLEGLVGQHMQRPPIYSAIRVDGRRAYEAARAGEPLDLPLRPITIHQLSVDEVRLPEVLFTVKASKGTYIRAICRDIGETLGSGGHCLTLRRLEAAGFTVAQAVDIATLTDPDSGALAANLISPLDMLASLHRVDVSDALADRLRMGQRVNVDTPLPLDVPLRVAAPDNTLVCVASAQDAHTLKPERVMA